MKLMYVYILECSDQSYYTGVTNNLDKRLIEHNEGYDPDCYTYSRRPVKLVYYESCSSPREAIFFEKKIKGWSRAKKEALIDGNWEKIHELAKCRNKTSSDNFKK
jgi:putative endonuclease